MTNVPKDTEPCLGCGREVDECHCPLDPELDESFDPLQELDGYDADWDEYERGDLHNVEYDDASPGGLG